MQLNATRQVVMWINADLGEGCAHDEALFKIIDWANIACGGHTGDKLTIRLACMRALEYGVQIGAHPSYPDRAGFGRRKPEGSSERLLCELKRQMDLFENSAAKLGCTPLHFKPHGQLYNDAAFQVGEAELLIDLAHAFPHLKLLALAGSPLVAWARSAGIAVIEEAFPDRAYLSTGELAPRSRVGAVLHDPDQVKAQATSIIRGRPLQCLDGLSRMVTAQTLCVHGDNAHALENAKAVRAAVAVHDQD
jgi:5-oxoprolinase (ATP-hydrolysing) subunit A